MEYMKIFFMALPSENQACQLYFPILQHTAELKNELIRISFSFILFLVIVNMHVFFLFCEFEKKWFPLFSSTYVRLSFFMMSRFNSNCRDVELFFFYIYKNSFTLCLSISCFLLPVSQSVAIQGISFPLLFPHLILPFFFIFTVTERSSFYEFFFFQILM